MASFLMFAAVVFIHAMPIILLAVMLRKLAEKPLKWRVILIFGLLGAGVQTTIGLLPHSGFLGSDVMPIAALLILGYIVASRVNYRRYGHAETSGAVAYLVNLLMTSKLVTVSVGHPRVLANEVLANELVTPELTIPLMILIILGLTLIGLVIASITTGIGAWIYEKKETW